MRARKHLSTYDPSTTSERDFKVWWMIFWFHPSACEREGLGYFLVLPHNVVLWKCGEGFFYKRNLTSNF